MLNKQSFIKGTMILMCANAISKILGAVFKIPLTYLLKEEGMAIYNTAFNVYVMLLSFIISGMPLAISKLIAEESALGHEGNVKKTVTTATALLGILGIAGTVILWFGADFFAIAMKESKSVFCIKIIAPSVFFVALGTVWKSYYQGRTNMTPTAISQVIEAFVKLIAGFAFALYYSNLAAEYTAAAAIMGVTLGEIIATFILFIEYLPHLFSKRKKEPPTLSSRSVIDSLLSVAAPAIIASAISSFINLADITVIRRSLEHILFTPESAEKFLLLYSPHTNLFDSLTQDLKITADGSRWLYGAYSGYALTVFHLPVGILGALGVSILPIIAGALAVKNTNRASFCTNIAAKLTLLVCLPAAFIIGLFSEPILALLFKNTASSLLLQSLAPCLVFITLSQLFTACLNASGKIISPFIFGFISGGIKIILSAFLIKIPGINMLGACISANISYLVLLILTCIPIKKQFEISLLKLFLKPFLCAGVMALMMRLVYSPFTVIFSNDAIALLLSAIIGGIAYILMLICTKTLNRQEFLSLKKDN